MGWLEGIFAGVSSSILVNPIYFFLITILAISLWGDASMIALSIVAKDLDIAFWIVLLGGYIGATIGDTAWFVVGKKLLPILIAKKNNFKKNYNRIIKHLNRITHKNIFLTLCIVKFLYGTRVITVFYLANKNIGMSKFLKYNSVALFLWVAFMGTIGYLVAIGFTFLVSAVKNIQLAVTMVILFFIILNIIQRKINKELEQK